MRRNGAVRLVLVEAPRFLPRHCLVRDAVVDVLMEILRQRPGQEVEGHRLQVVADRRFAEDAQGGGIGKHALDHRAQFHPLRRRAARQHFAPRVDPHRQPVVAFEMSVPPAESIAVRRVTRALKIDRRHLGGLRHVDRMLRHRVVAEIHEAVRGIDLLPGVSLFREQVGEARQESVAGPVVEPEDRLDFVPGPRAAPRAERPRPEVRTLIFVVGSQERNHPRVAGGLVEVPQHVVHEHARPPVVVVRAVEPVGPL